MCAAPNAQKALISHIASVAKALGCVSGTTNRLTLSSRIARCGLIVAIAVALSYGIEPVLNALGLHGWAKATLGRYGFYELYIACEFLLAIAAVAAMWRAGLAQALNELGIVHVSIAGCLSCLLAIVAALCVLLLARAKWTPDSANALIVFGVVGPFVEEVLFRGFLFRQMRRWAALPFWIAALLSALLFGAVHFDQGDTLANSLMNSGITFIGGLLFCWLVERWNSIWPGFIIHAGLNLLWSVYTLGDNAVGGEMGNLARLAAIVVALAATFAIPRTRRAAAPELARAG